MARAWHAHWWDQSGAAVVYHSFRKVAPSLLLFARAHAAAPNTCRHFDCIEVTRSVDRVWEKLWRPANNPSEVRLLFGIRPARSHYLVSMTSIQMRVIVASDIVYGAGAFAVVRGTWK